LQMCLMGQSQCGRRSAIGLSRIDHPWTSVIPGRKGESTRQGRFTLRARRSDAKERETVPPHMGVRGPRAAPPSPARLARWVVVVGVVLAGGILAGSVVWYEYQPGGAFNPIVQLQVDVTQVVWTYFGTPESSSPGFDVEAGTPVGLSIILYCAPTITGFEVQTCDSGSPFIQTAGFGLMSTNTPFQWSSGYYGATATVHLVISTPTQDFSGNLTIELH